jgi:hypothetical protein
LVPLWGKVLLGLLLIVVGALLVYMLVALWPPVQHATAAGEPSSTNRTEAKTISFFGASYSPDADATLLLLVAVLSALGSYVHAAQSFVDSAGNRRLVVSWVWSCIFRIFIGVPWRRSSTSQSGPGSLARTGRRATSTPYGIAAVAGLVGLFSKQATDKLREVFETLFRTAPG